MSASREKKNRQDLASQGIKDPKAIREAEEKAKLRKANRLYGTIAVVFVVVAALLLVVKSGVLYRDPDAVTIDGQNYTVAQVNYYYRGLANNIAKAGYYGLDNSKPLTDQVMNDTAKMLLQVTDEGDVTWDQFLKEYAVKQLSQDVGIPADLKDIVKPEDVDFLAQSAYDDACRPGNPRDTSVEEIKQLYLSLM